MSVSQTSSLWLASLARPLASFASRDYRWLWTNNALLSLGLSMEMLAQGWLVLEMTDSPFWVGLVAGVRGIGSVALSAPGGLLADRVNRRNALVVVHATQGLAVLTLALLILVERIELWHVVGVALLRGVGMGLSVPANSALIYDTVGRELLLNAMAARNAAFNVARIVGGVLAGTLISVFGMGVCYLAIVAALAVSLLALLFVRGRAPVARASESIARNLLAGLAYVSRNRSLRLLLVFSILMEGFGFSHVIILPVVARDVLHVGAYGLGLLSTAAGVGAMVGTITVASLGDFRAKGHLLAFACGATGLFLFFFALSPWFVASLALIALMNAMLWAYDSTMGAVLQLLSSEEMRGRVLGLYVLTWGFTSLGGFVLAAVATALSAPFALGMGALVILGYTARSAKPLTRLREASESLRGG